MIRGRNDTLGLDGGIEVPTFNLGGIWHYNWIFHNEQLNMESNLEKENKEIEGNYEIPRDVLINIVFSLGGDTLKSWKIITTLVDIFVS